MKQITKSKVWPSATDCRLGPFSRSSAGRSSFRCIALRCLICTSDERSTAYCQKFCRSIREELAHDTVRGASSLVSLIHWVGSYVYFDQSTRGRACRLVCYHASSYFQSWNRHLNLNDSKPHSLICPWYKRINDGCSARTYTLTGWPNWSSRHISAPFLFSPRSFY